MVGHFGTIVRQKLYLVWALQLHQQHLQPRLQIQLQRDTETLLPPKTDTERVNTVKAISSTRVEHVCARTRTHTCTHIHLSACWTISCTGIERRCLLSNCHFEKWAELVVLFSQRALSSSHVHLVIPNLDNTSSRQLNSSAQLTLIVGVFLY